MAPVFEDEEDEPFIPATDADVTRIAKKWKLTPALQALRNLARPLDIRGREWDITLWRPRELAAEKAKFAGALDGFDSDEY